MPEEFDEQEVRETQEQEVVETEVEAEEQRVPVHVVKELRDELRQAREESNLTRSQFTQLMSEYQKMVNGQKNRMEEVQENLDPEVQKLLKPYLRPVEEELRRTKAELEEVNRSRATIEAERYIERNVPNLNEIRPHLAKFIQSEYTPEEQAELTPKEVVRIAKFVAKQQGISATAKQVARSAARTESGSPTSNRNESVKPSELQGDKFTEYLKANGFFD